MLKMSRSDAHAFAMIKMHVNAPKNVVKLVLVSETHHNCCGTSYTQSINSQSLIFTIGNPIENHKNVGYNV